MYDDELFSVKLYDDELFSVKLYDDELVFGLLNSPLWKLYDDKFIALFQILEVS